MFQNQENEHVRQNSRDCTASVIASGGVNTTPKGAGQKNFTSI